MRRAMVVITVVFLALAGTVAAQRRGSPWAAR